MVNGVLIRGFYPYLFNSKKLEIINRKEGTSHREPAECVDNFQGVYQKNTVAIPESVRRSGLPEMVDELDRREREGEAKKGKEGEGERRRERKPNQEREDT